MKLFIIKYKVFTSKQLFNFFVKILYLLYILVLSHLIKYYKNDSHFRKRHHNIFYKLGNNIIDYYLL